MSCRIVTGKRGEGKTTLMLKLAEAVSNPLGFVSIHDHDSYYLKNLATGESRLLMTDKPLFPFRVGKFFADSAVFDYAEKTLSEIEKGDVFLDEIGALELSGKGFDEILRKLLKKKITLTIAVRDTNLESVIDHYGIKDCSVLKVGASSLALFSLRQSPHKDSH